MEIVIQSAKPIEQRDTSKDKVTKKNKKTGKSYETYPSFSPRKWLNNLFVVHYKLDSVRMPRNLDDYQFLSADTVKKISDAQNKEFKRLGWDMRLDLLPDVQFKAILSGTFEPQTYDYQDEDGNKHYGLAIQYEYKESPKPLGITLS